MPTVLRVRPRNSLTGNIVGSLDNLEGSNLNDGDMVLVITDTYTYTYILDATSGAAPSSPDIIAPSSNPGTKRWILKGPYLGNVDHGDMAGLLDNDHTQYITSVASAPLTLAAQTITFNYDSNDFNLSGNNLQVTDSGIDHDGTTNFVLNEHINHTDVSISAGGILSGGGDISANRTITLAHGDVDHDQTANFAANEHFTEASIDHGSIAGIGDDDHPHYTLADGTRGFTGTVSGVTPTEDAHLTRKDYVDDAITTATGSLTTNHNELTNISGGASDDYFHLTGVQHTDLTDTGNTTLHKHDIYPLADGTRGFSATVSGATPIDEDDLATKGYVDGEINAGISWTARSAAEANSWQAVVYGNGLFVAVASDGTNKVMTSPDGVNWTANTDDGGGDSWNDITYGNGLFVAVGKEGATGDAIMTSPDGITWTTRTAAAGWFSSITYGQNLFVAIEGDPDGSANPWYSSDGITWTEGAGVFQVGWTAITYGNGLFVAVGVEELSNLTLLTSPDGSTWTQRNIKNGATNYDWGCVTYGNGLFVALSNDGADRSITSTDGITWTHRAIGLNGSWNSIVYANGLFVAVSDANERVMTSPDGITWTARTAAESNSWNGITYGNGSFVAVSSDGTNRVMTSGKTKNSIPPNNNVYQGGMDVIGNFFSTGTVSGTSIYGDGSNLTGLHTRSHTMTSTSDHTAGNYKVFYSDGSGQVQELALSTSGTVLTSNGAAAAPSFETGGGLSNIVEDATPQLGGDLDLNGHNIDFPTTANISDCLDEDNMASDSATALATQQSIKKYVDDNAGGDVVDDTTPQLGGDLDLNDNNIDYGAIQTTISGYEGEIMTVTVDDGSASFFNGLYQADDFNYERADASASGTMPCIAIAVENGSGSKKVFLRGQICNTAWNWSMGDIYLSAAVGEFTQDPVDTSDTWLYEQIVGWALSANTMFFDPVISREFTAISGTHIFGYVAGQRGLFGGGYNGGPKSNTISYITISTTSNATDFGDMISAKYGISAFSNGTNDRGIFGGGKATDNENVIEYVTISTPSNSTNFGDLTIARRALGGLSNGTNERGCFCGGYVSDGVNTIDYVTINSASNATNFGDLLNEDGEYVGTCSNAANERGIIAGGNGGDMNIIEYITINSASNALDFGDLLFTNKAPAGTSNGINERGIFGGGETTNTINYITINTPGNAIDFGDLTLQMGESAATSNGTNERGVFGGGYTGSFPEVNTIDYVTINSAGNALDFGDLLAARGWLAGCSDA